MELPSYEEVYKNYDLWVVYKQNLEDLLYKVYQAEKETIIIRNLFNNIVKSKYPDKIFYPDKIIILKNTDTHLKVKYKHKDVLIIYKQYYAYTQYSDCDSVYEEFVSVNNETKLRTKKNISEIDMSFGDSEESPEETPEESSLDED